jgi:hypothetical protein
VGPPEIAAEKCWTSGMFWCKKVPYPENMDVQPQSVKMATVEADTFEAVGYEDGSRSLVIKFRNAPTIRFEKVPRFRYQGLLSAPRKDAYYKTFIKDQFLSKTMEYPL